MSGGGRAPHSEGDQKQPHDVVQGLLVVSAEEMASVVSLADAVEIQRRAFVEYSSGNISNPAHTVLTIPQGTAVIMPAWLNRTGDLGLKALTAYPENLRGDRPVNQAVVVIFDERTGAPSAVLDGTWITAVRTGVAAALGVSALARTDTSSLAMLGSGPVAYWAVLATCRVRPIGAIRIWSRDITNAEKLAAKLSHVITQQRIEPVATIDKAVRGAEAVVTATPATTTLVDAEHIDPGSHVSSLGDNELGLRLLVRARVIVDSLKTCWTEAPELASAQNDGHAGEVDVAGELGDVLSGRRVGRRSSEDITVFKSTGLGFQDVALGGEIARRVRQARSPNH